MQSVNFIYKLGMNAEQGIDVFELAPILTAVGELIKESNRVVYPNGKDLSVNVKPFEKGSFIIDILLFAAEHRQQIADFAQSDAAIQIKDVLQLIGIIGGTTINEGAISLIELIKLLKGKASDVERVGQNQVKYTGVDGDSVAVTDKVHMLFQNCNIQQMTYNAFGKPLEKSDINTVECFIKDEEQATKEVFNKQEYAESLKTYSKAKLPTLDDVVIIENTIETYLSPKRGSYDADPRQWSFRMGADNQIIQATIKDERFLEDCRSGKVKPHYLDVMKVKLLQRFKRKNGRIDLDSVINEIQEVVEYQEGICDEQGQIPV
jgi:hypothetical protein